MRLAAEFGLEVWKIAPARAGAGGVAALRHEAWNHAVEDHPIVKAVSGEAGDPLDMAWREVRAELDDDIAAARKGEGQRVGVGHRLILDSGEFRPPCSGAFAVAPVRWRA